MKKRNMYLVLLLGLLIDALKEQGYIKENGRFDMQKAKADKEFYSFWVRLKNIYTALNVAVAKLKYKEKNEAAKEVDSAIEKMMPETIKQSYLMLIVALEVGERFNLSKVPKDLLLKAELNKFEALNQEAIGALREVAGREAIRASKILANSISDYIEFGKVVPVEVKLDYTPKWARGVSNG